MHEYDFVHKYNIIYNKYGDVNRLIKHLETHNEHNYNFNIYILTVKGKF